MPTYTVKMKYAPYHTPMTGFASLAECQSAYIKQRDESGLGASEWGPAGVIDNATKAKVAHISYNGRVWRNETSWQSEKPILEVTA